MHGKNKCIKCDSDKDVYEKIKGNWFCCDCLNKYSLWNEIDEKKKKK